MGGGEGIVWAGLIHIYLSETSVAFIPPTRAQKIRYRRRLVVEMKASCQKLSFWQCTCPAPSFEDQLSHRRQSVSALQGPVSRD
jgi:hypothetical protein